MVEDEGSGDVRVVEDEDDEEEGVSLYTSNCLIDSFMGIAICWGWGFLLTLG